MITEANSQNYYSLVSSGDVLVDCWATWCGPCRMASSHLPSVQKEFPNLKIVKMNVEDCSDISDELGITNLPTFLFYKNGELVDQLTGFNPRGLQSFIENNLE